MNPARERKVLRMTEETSAQQILAEKRAEQRAAWDASYREKNREKRRQYDRDRLRRIRGGE